jgi:tartrate dehydratase beta subunit/fumarate hydratase class I family protein
MNIYKTMYHAPKPEGIEKRKAYIVGGGIAGLAPTKIIGPINPSTSYRMDYFTPKLIENGLHAIIGKGNCRPNLLTP